MSVDDMPTWNQLIGKKKRRRVDPVAMDDLFQTYKLMGASLVVIEDVAGRGNQMGGAAFSYGIGVLDTVAMYSGIPVEKVTPMTWKKALNVPGKSRADDSAILKRANELFPNHRDLFKGKRGGKLIDRAEASMIALFGARFILHTLDDGMTHNEIKALKNKRKLGLTGGM